MKKPSVRSFLFLRAELAFVLLFVFCLPNLITNLISYASAEEAVKQSDAPRQYGQNPVGKYADRWFYASIRISSEKETNELIDIIKRAGKADLNGALLACSIDTYANWPAESKLHLEQIKAAAKEANIEIIPIIWSIGYGFTIGYDLNMAEGKEVVNVPFTACVQSNDQPGTALFSTQGQNLVVNPGFEEAAGASPKGFAFVDKPGQIVCMDKTEKFSGEQSLKLGNYELDQYQHARALQKISVKPNRQYCVSIRYKTKGFSPAGAFRIQVYKEKDGIITSSAPVIDEKGNQDWSVSKVFFNSGNETKILLYIGAWGGQTGNVWIDDLCVEELGMYQVLDRPGTPITVRNAQTGQEYLRYKDFDLPKNYKIRWNDKETDSVDLVIPPGSQIKDKDELLVNYYQLLRLGSGQVSTCMSEPQLYKRLEESAKGIMDALAPKKWFLSMDEIRAGGSCKACQDRKLPLSQILGDCITKQYKIIQSVQPGADVYIWSDMLDPKHNAHDNYYNCVGDFAGVWNYIPKELIISCWYCKIREDSLKFFNDLGFRTQAAAYYDADNLDNCENWLESINHTPRCTGIMYTTWQGKYALLEPFADLIRENSRPEK